jgi:hypothetical protein
MIVLSELKNLEKVQLILDKFAENFYRVVAPVEIVQKKLLRVQTVHMKPFNRDLWIQCPNATSLFGEVGLIRAIATSNTSDLPATRQEFSMLRHLCTPAMGHNLLLLRK